MEVEITAKNISRLPIKAAFFNRHAFFQFSKNVFGHHNTIIHYQAGGQYNGQQGKYINRKPRNVHDKET